MKKWCILLVLIACLPAVSAAQSLPVILYHGITDSEVSKENFDNQMAALKNAGYTPVSELNALNYLDGKTTLPAKPVLITFDDGRDASFYPADPILKKYGFRATIYLITKQNTKSKVTYYLNKSEVQHMIDTGRWDADAHAKDAHEMRPIDGKGNVGPFLTSKLWLSGQDRVETTQEFDNRINAELQGVKDDLKENFGVTAHGFAYPFGQYGQNPTNFNGAKDIVLDATRARYSGAFYQNYQGEGFTHNYPGTNSFLAKRIPVNSDWDGSDLIAKLQRGQPKSLNYWDTLSPDRGWEQSYGSLTLTRGVLILKASGSSGAAAFLDGTYLWKDYTYTATIKQRNTATVSLLARMENPNTYVGCEFSGTGAKITQRVAGTSYTLATKSGLTFPSSNYQLSIKVDGDKVSCMYKDSAVVSATMRSNSPSKGGIGLKVEASQNDYAQVKLEDVKATSIS